MTLLLFLSITRSLLEIQVKPKICLTLTVLGFMQFVQSVPVAEVLATEGNIQVSRNNSFTSEHLATIHDLFAFLLNLFLQSFFRKHAPSEKGPYGISSEVMDTYVKSCGESLGSDELSL